VLCSFSGRQVIRVASGDTHLGGYRVKEGSLAMCSIANIHRSPRYWGPDPDDFRPERFLQGEVRGGGKGGKWW
jgi:cytochrome P450